MPIHYFRGESVCMRVAKPLQLSHPIVVRTLDMPKRLKYSANVHRLLIVKTDLPGFQREGESVATLAFDCKASRGDAAILKSCFESFRFHGGRVGQVKWI